MSVRQYPAGLFPRGESTTHELVPVDQGIQYCKPKEICRPRQTGCFRLYFILEGKGVFQTRDQQFALQKEDVAMAAPDAPILLSADSHTPWRYTWVAFLGDSAAKYMQYAGFSPEVPIQRSLVPNSTYQQIVEELLQLRENSLANLWERTSLLYHLLSVLIDMQRGEIRAGHAVYDYPQKTYVAYAMDYITYTYAHIKIGDVAAYMGVNRAYLSAAFQQVVGITAQEYLIRFRLEKAADLLRTTSWPLRIIAHQVGYEDAFSLSKAFKAKRGLSPNAYRKSLQDNGIGGTLDDKAESPSRNL